MNTRLVHVHDDATLVHPSFEDGVLAYALEVAVIQVFGKKDVAVFLIAFGAQVILPFGSIAGRIEFGQLCRERPNFFLEQSLVHGNGVEVYRINRLGGG